MPYPSVQTLLPAPPRLPSPPASLAPPRLHPWRPSFPTQPTVHSQARQAGAIPTAVTCTSSAGSCQELSDSKPEPAVDCKARETTQKSNGHSPHPGPHTAIPHGPRTHNSPSRGILLPLPCVDKTNATKYPAVLNTVASPVCRTSKLPGSFVLQ